MAEVSYSQLRAFHAVAVTGGFTAAARRLGRTQPAISQQVSGLERDHGVELFVRGTRHVGLTEAGEQLLAITRRLFDVEQEAAQLLADAAGLRRGRLRLGADGPFHVVEMLAAFRDRYPGIDVSVAVGNSADIRARLERYEVDVAVLAQVDDDDALHAVSRDRQRVVAFAARDHRWARRRSIRMGELDGEPMVRREAGSTTQRAFDRAARAANVTPRVVVEIGSREGVREAVARGLGVGVVSEPELGHDDRIVALPFRDAEVLTSEYVVCLRERRASRIVSAFLDVVNLVR